MTTPEERADRVEIVMGEMTDGIEYVKDAETRANIAAAIAAAEREARTASVQDAIRAMTEEQRVEIFSGFGEFCRCCGGPAYWGSQSCQCWNDE